MSYTEKSKHKLSRPSTNRADSAPANESTTSQIATYTDFVDSHKVGMLTTVNTSGLLVSRCMAVADRENTVDLIFHTHAESGKTDDIDNNSNVSVSFYKDSTGEWLSVSGKAELVTDRQVVEKYYSKSLKAWIGDKGDGVHDGGPQDPRIGIIRVKTSTVTYAVQTATTIGKYIGIAKGVVTGEVPSINSIVELTEKDIAAARK